MLLLPKWILTKGLPAYMDAESGTCLEQTYKIYGKMNELIEDYNNFVDDANKTIEDHINTCEEDHDVFATALRQEFKDFIDVVELKLMDIEETMKQVVLDDIVEYTNTEIRSMVETMINNEIATIRAEINDIKALYLTTDSFNTQMQEVETQLDNVKNQVQTLEQEKLDKTEASNTYLTQESYRDSLEELNNTIDTSFNNMQTELNKKATPEDIDNAIATAITETLGGNY